jgi:hypothetical protein
MFCTLNGANPRGTSFSVDKREGKGVLSAVEYIRRSETHGGVAGGVGCDPEHSGAIARIPYTAVYTFYALHP